MNLKELLDITVRPYMPPALIQSTALERINKVANQLPERLTSFFGFECRLGDTKPNADFLLCIFKDNYGQHILANPHTQENQLPKAWLNHPTWKRIFNFAQNWAAETPSLFQQVDNVWLEFDIEEKQVDTIPIPSFFFAPYDPIKKVFLKEQESIDTIIMGLKTIKTEQIDKVVEERLQTVIQALPTSAFVFQVGTMLSRAVQTYRVCIRNISIKEIPLYLKKIDWSGDQQALNNLLQTLKTYVDRVDLDIDVNEGVAAKIGLECYLDLDERREKRWQNFLHFLENNNLCTDLKKNALASFTGIVHQGMSLGKIWPTHLQQMAGFIGNKYLSMYYRDIHHIKLSYEGNTILDAKAYLRVTHTWASKAKIKEGIRKTQSSLIAN